MPIVGFNFTKLSADRKKEQIKGDVKVKNDLLLQSLTQTDIDMAGKKQPVLKLVFDFLIDYQPGIGNLILSGHLLFADTPENVKSIMDMWKKEKKIPQQYAINFINVILTRSNIKALELSQAIVLPPHFRLPTVLPKQDFKNYIG